MHSVLPFSLQQWHWWVINLWRTSFNIIRVISRYNTNYVRVKESCSTVKCIFKRATFKVIYAISLILYYWFSNCWWLTTSNCIMFTSNIIFKYSSQRFLTQHTKCVVNFHDIQTQSVTVVGLNLFNRLVNVCIAFKSLLWKLQQFFIQISLNTTRLC